MNCMSAETVGRHMPPVITLDDLTAMMAADEHHRYEVSPEGALSVMPPAGHTHATCPTGPMGGWRAPANSPNPTPRPAGCAIPRPAGAAGGRTPTPSLART